MERNDKGQFLKGRIMTREERLRQSIALSNSAKKRPDYIGDIKAECPRVFNSWRAILYTEKGRRAGCVDCWKDFRTFYNDVRPSYKPGLLFRRKDVYLPWGPGNFLWVTNEESGLMKRSRYIEFNGKNQSISEWADELNVSVSAITNRYTRMARQGLSIEQVLYGRRGLKRMEKEAKDIRDEGVNIRAKASKMISSYKHKDISNHLSACDITIDWMIENILTKPCHYCGDNKRVGCDRIDNKKGHTKDNVVPCCVECNTARNKYFTYDEMRILGRTIAEIKRNRKR